jgi:hypothetical protein
MDSPTTRRSISVEIRSRAPGPRGERAFNRPVDSTIPVNTGAVYFDADDLPSFLDEPGRWFGQSRYAQWEPSNIVVQVREPMTMRASAPTM